MRVFDVGLKSFVVIVVVVAAAAVIVHFTPTHPHIFIYVYTVYTHTHGRVRAQPEAERCVKSIIWPLRYLHPTLRPTSVYTQTRAYIYIYALYMALLLLLLSLPPSDITYCASRYLPTSSAAVTMNHSSRCAPRIIRIIVVRRTKKNRTGKNI